MDTSPGVVAVPIYRPVRAVTSGYQMVNSEIEQPFPHLMLSVYTKIYEEPYNTIASCPKLTVLWHRGDLRRLDPVLAFRGCHET